MERIATLMPPSQVPVLELKERYKNFSNYNRMRLKRIMSLLPQMKRDIFNFIPLTLHTNFQWIPGASANAPYGIADFYPSPDIQAVLLRLFHVRKFHIPPPAHTPIRSLLCMGSLGTFGHNRRSDADFWVCIDKISAEDQKLLHEKCIAIENWAARFHFEVHFFIMNVSDILNNDFGGVSAESCGSAMAMLLKEELYRSSVLITGLPPAWWMAPASCTTEYYNKVVKDLNHRRPLQYQQFLDMGAIDNVPVDEFFGASMWQMLKALPAPFKSLLKMALLLRYLDSGTQEDLLCEFLKLRIHRGDPAEDLADPYLLMFDAAVEYFEKKGELTVIDLLSRAFYIKTGIQLSRWPENDEDPLRRKEMMERYVERWGWSEEEIIDMDNFSSWPWERKDQVGQMVLELINNLNKTLHEKITGIVDSAHISYSDMKILTNKIDAAVSDAPGKVTHLHSYFFEPITPEKTLFFHKHRTGKWSVSRSDKTTTRQVQENFKNKIIPSDTKPLYTDQDPIQVIAWAVKNNLYGAHTRIGVIGDEQRKTRMLHRAGRAILNLCKKAHPLNQPTENFRYDPIPLRNLIFIEAKDPDVNDGVAAENWDPLSYGKKKEVLFNDGLLYTLNNWGELHSKRFYQHEGLIKLIQELNTKDAPQQPIEVLEVSGDTQGRTARRLDQLLNATTFTHSPDYKTAHLFYLGNSLMAITRTWPSATKVISVTHDWLRAAMVRCNDLWRITADETDPFLSALQYVLSRAHEQLAMFMLNQKKHVELFFSDGEGGIWWETLRPNHVKARSHEIAKFLQECHYISENSPCYAYDLVIGGDGQFIASPLNIIAPRLSAHDKPLIELHGDLHHLNNLKMIYGDYTWTISDTTTPDAQEALSYFLSKIRLGKESKLEIDACHFTRKGKRINAAQVLYWKDQARLKMLGSIKNYINSFSPLKNSENVPFTNIAAGNGVARKEAAKN